MRFLKTIDVQISKSHQQIVMMDVYLFICSKLLAVVVDLFSVQRHDSIFSTGDMFDTRCERIVQIAVIIRGNPAKFGNDLRKRPLVAPQNRGPSHVESSDVLEISTLAHGFHQYAPKCLVPTDEHEKRAGLFENIIMLLPPHHAILSFRNALFLKCVWRLL